MVIKGVGVVSLAKFMGLLYAGIGFLIGILLALFGLLGGGAMMAAAGADQGGAGLGMLAGMGFLAVLILPICYGLLGFIGGLITGFLFNLVAKFTGGLELEIQ